MCIRDSAPAVYNILEWLPNRVNHPAGVSPMMMPRIKTMRTRFGGTVTFEYNDEATVKNTCPTSNWHVNTELCFPGWDSTGPQPGFVAWHRYRVEKTTVDTIAGSDLQVTDYTYGPAAWTFTDNPNSTQDTWNTFAGHAWTNSTIGKDTSEEQQTISYFHQGLHGDHRPGGGTLSKSVTRDEEAGSSIEDSYWLRGRTYETKTLDSQDQRISAAFTNCLLYTSPSPRDRQKYRMPSSA